MTSKSGKKVHSFTLHIPKTFFTPILLFHEILTYTACQSKYSTIRDFRVIDLFKQKLYLRNKS